MIGGRTSSETLRGRTQNGRVSCDFQAASAETLRGRSKDSFQKKITFQKITKEGIQAIGQSIEIMAESEQLFAHKNAVTLRLKDV